MKFTRISILAFGIFLLLIFFYFKESVILGNCDGDPMACRKLGAYADYLWPLWNYSRAMIIIGLLVLWKPVSFRSLSIFTIISTIGITLGVILAPEMSSDFLIPIEKKSVGYILSILYLMIGGGLFVWSVRKKSP